MGYFDKFRQIIGTAAKVTETVGTQVYRKAKKPFRQYMAPERAQKAIEKHQEIPRRAPMNLPKIDFSKEKINENKAKVKEILQKSDQLIEHMQKMKIRSHDPSAVGVQEETSHRKPQARTLQEFEEQEVPRGLITLVDMIQLLHNHHLQPGEWTAEELAERFKLRESDVKNVLESVELVQPKDRIEQ